MGRDLKDGTTWEDVQEMNAISKLRALYHILTQWSAVKMWSVSAPHRCSREMNEELEDVAIEVGLSQKAVRTIIRMLHEEGGNGRPWDRAPEWAQPKGE